MTKVLNAGTLAEIVNAGIAVGGNPEQFERSIWALRAESYRQLAKATEAVYVGVVTLPVFEAAKAYLADFKNNGSLTPFIEALNTAATKSLSAEAVSDVALDLVRRCAYCLDLDKCWWRSVAMRNRAAQFFYMPNRPDFVPLQATFEAWAESAGVNPTPIPDSPYSTGTITWVVEKTLRQVIEQGRIIATSASDIAENVACIESVGYAAVYQAADAFVTQCGQLEVKAVDAARAYIAAHIKGEKLDEPLKELFDATRYYQLAVKNPVGLALPVLQAAGRAIELIALHRVCDELSKRTAKFGDMTKDAAYPAMAAVFKEWKAQQQAK